MKFYNLQADLETIPNPHTLLGQIGFKVPPEQQIRATEETPDRIVIARHLGMAGIEFASLKKNNEIVDDAPEPEFVHIETAEQIDAFSPVTPQHIDVLSWLKQPNIEHTIYHHVPTDLFHIVGGKAKMRRVELSLPEAVRRYTGLAKPEIPEGELVHDWVKTPQNRHWQPLPIEAPATA